MSGWRTIRTCLSDPVFTGSITITLIYTAAAVTAEMVFGLGIDGAGCGLESETVAGSGTCLCNAGVLVLAFVFPPIWALGLSLKTRSQTFATPPLYLWWPTLENYADVLTRADFVQAFINTLIVSTSAVVLSLCVGAPSAYAFARFPFTGRTFLFFALLVMRMLPPIAVLVPMYVLFSKLGLATTRFSVVLADTTFALPLVVWLMREFFEDLPAELEESAWIDGEAAIVRSGTSFCHWGDIDDR